MLLSELMKVIEYTEVINRTGIDPKSVDVVSLCSDSRKVLSDSIFVCISGSISDGHEYAQNAYSRNCRIFVAERAIALPDDAFVIITKTYLHPACKQKRTGSATWDTAGEILLL